MTIIQQDENWRWRQFNQLNVNELYQLLQLREQVFQIEQNSLYVDLDDQDQQALHLLVSQQDKLLGYLRLLQPRNDVIKLGRIVLQSEARGSGLGRRLIDAGLAKARQLNATATVQISAQTALEGYYQSFGFVTVSEPYDDGGVLHQDMVLG